MEGPDYEAVDYGDPAQRVPLPIKATDLLPLKPRSQTTGSGKHPPLPPGKPRYAKDPVKSAPPPLAALGKKPPVNMPSVAPKPSSYSSTNLPASAPPTSKKPPTIKKRNESLPAKIRSSSQDSGNVHLPQPPDTSQWRSPSPSNCVIVPPPLPDREAALLLPDLVRKFSKELPLRVRVEEGYCGSEERYVISAGDIYNFHFVKNEKVVSVSDCGSNHFSIHFNSEIKFGLLYNPNDNFKEAIKGYTFKSVSDLVSSPTTPRMVRMLTASSKDSPDRSLINKSDLLVIKKAGRTLMRKPFIKVFSLNSQEEKTLHDDPENSFTTEPRSLQLYIPEILEHFPDSFPLAAMMYPPGEDTDDLPPHLTTDMVTLTHTSIESAIIATTHWGDEDECRDNIDEEDQVPISIPIEMEIEVTILNDTDEDELYFDTKTLLQHLDFSKVKDMKNDSAASSGGEGGIGERKLSQQLSHRVRKGYEFKGVNITVSQKVSNDPGLSSAAFRSALTQPLPAPPLGLPSEAAHPPSILSPSRHNSQAPVKPVHTSRTQTPSPIPPSAPAVPLRGKSLDDTELGNVKLPRTKPRSSTFAEVSYTDGDYENSDELYGNSPSAAASLQRPPRSSLPAGPSHKVGGDNSDTAHFAKKVNDDIEFLRRLVTVMQDNSLKDMTFLREEVKTLSTTVATLMGTVETLSGQCRQLESQVQGLKHRPVPRKNSSNGNAESADTRELTKTMDPQRQKENVANLRAMGTPEMQHLLEVMKLTQYKQLFQEESIDGEILAECDEELLEQELHITNKLHRSRLLKVISGRHSVTNIQHGLDPYLAV